MTVAFYMCASTYIDLYTSILDVQCSCVNNCSQGLPDQEKQQLVDQLAQKEREKVNNS